MAGHKGPLRIAIEDFLETGPLGKIIKGGIKSYIEEYEQDLIANNRELINLVLNNPDIPPEIRAILQRSFSGSRQAGIITLLTMAIGAIIPIVMGMMQPVSRSGEHVVDTILRTNRMSPSEFIPSVWRVGPSPDRGYGDLYDLGWSNENVERWKAILEPQIAESDLMRLYWREQNLRGYVRGELAKRGWSADNIERLVRASMVMPGLNDLVSMAVREVFDPAQRSSLGLDAEFPSEFAVRAEMIGVDPQFAKDYWAAHWQLPSLQMGFQMFQRLRPGTTSVPVDRNMISALIKAHDFSPVWRDRLIELSYTPLTRVDIRRMYQIGAMTRAEVYEAYLDLGYNPINAQRLTDFATLDTGESGKDLTRSAIQDGYVKGLMTFDAALSSLIELGYSEDEAIFWLALKDFQYEEKLDKQRVEIIEMRLLEGEIDLITAQNELHNLQMPNEFVAIQLEEWRLKLAKRVKYPSKAEIEDLYENDLIDLGTVTDLMQKRGYRPDIAAALVRLIDIRVEKSRQRDLEATQKEQERLASAESTTDYQIARADFDVQIAELRAYIADLKVAQHFVETTQQLEELKQAIDIAKSDIAAISLKKAELKSDYVSE